MASTLKVISSEVSLSNTTSSNVSSASLVRLICTHVSSSAVINLLHANGDLKATTTVGHIATNSARLILVKQPDELLKLSNTSISTAKATSIAYS